MSRKIVVVGAGPGGYSAALSAAEMGAEVCLVEGGELGGVCLNRGCVPSKIMKEGADLLGRCRRGEEFGLDGIERGRVHMPRLTSRKEHLLQSQRKAMGDLLARAGVEVVYGWGRVPEAGRMHCRLAAGGEREILWDALIAATGSRPMSLPGVDFDGRFILSSSDLFNLDRVPESMLIVGAGVVGCEFASIMAAFGCRVTLVELTDRILPLPGVDLECAKLLARRMKRDGIRVLLKSRLRAVRQEKDGVEVEIYSEGGGADAKGQRLRVETLLLAVGRAPSGDDLGLAALGADFDKGGWLQVDAGMRSRASGVYGVGDMLGPQRVMLAHVAEREGRIAARNAVLGEGALMDYNNLPLTIFTHPEIGAVGLSEEEAKEQGLEVICRKKLFRGVVKSHISGEIDGFVKVVASSGDGRLLGMQAVGPQASELLAVGGLALGTRSTLSDITTVVYSHPTLAEVMSGLGTF